MNPVESGVQVSGHRSAEKIHDDLSGGSGFDIARSDRGAGVDDDHRQAGRSEFSGHYLGSPFGELVGIGHLRLAHRRGFIGWDDGTVGAGLWQPDAADGAGVNDARASGLMGRAQDVPGAVHISSEHGCIIGQPQRIARGHVEAPVTPGHRPGEGGYIVGEVPGNRFVIAANEPSDIRPRAQQRSDRMPAGIQCMDQVGSDKTGGTGNKTTHGGRGADMWIYPGANSLRPEIYHEHIGD